MAVQTLKPLVTQKADCLPESGHFSGVVRGGGLGVVWSKKMWGVIGNYGNCWPFLNFLKISGNFYKHMFVFIKKSKTLLKK